MKRFFLSGAAVLVIDQTTKLVVKELMEVGQTIPVLPGIVQLTFIINPGASFGILPHQRPIIIAVTLVVVVLLVLYARRVLDNRLLQLALAMQLGGALGNLIDRLVHKGVIDFIDLMFWPVFNVADTAIVAGVGLLLLDMLLEWKGGQNEA